MRRLRPPRVALLMNADLGYNREVMLGVARYVAEHDDWQFFNAPPVAAKAMGDLATWRGEGIIALAHTPKQIEAIAARAIPAVNVSCSAEDARLPRVISDDFAAGRLAAEHFLARGYRHFGYVDAPDLHFACERGRGFRETLREAGLTCSFLNEDPDVRRARHIAQERAVGQWLLDLPKPAAVFVMNDGVAVGIIERCHEVGLSVPEEVALLGVDNDELVCNFCHPSLSSVQPDARRIGYEAARTLDDLMRGRTPAQQTRFIEPIGVVTRRSTDILAIEDELVATALRFIREHVQEGIEVDRVVEAVPLSRRVLERRFREALGRTPFDEIQRVRVDRARELLVSTTYALEQVAMLAGFKSAKRMGAVFRERTGRPPTHYRRQGDGGGDMR